LSPDNGDRLIEVGVALLASQQIVDRYQSLINPGVGVPSFVTQLTSITTSDVRSAPAASQVLEELRSCLGIVPLVAHNASFEQRFLDAEYSHVGLALGDVLVVLIGLCTLVGLYANFFSRHTLKRLYPVAAYIRYGLEYSRPEIQQCFMNYRLNDIIRLQKFAALLSITRRN
jgi:DNA polymerase III alpha subunit (gram-positive type)